MPDCTCRAFSGARDCPQHGFGVSDVTTGPQPSEAALDAAEAAVHACRKYALGHPSRKAIYVDARDEAYDVLMASGYPAEVERLRTELLEAQSHVGRANAREGYVRKLEAEVERLREELHSAEAIADAWGAENEKFREALTQIRDADPVDMALDPNWPARIAQEAIADRHRPT